MRAPYITAGEAAKLCGVDRRTIQRRVQLGELAGLLLPPGKVLRVEAAPLVPSAPAVWPDGPRPAPLEWVARMLRVHPDTVRRLVREEQLLAQRVRGRLWFTRRALYEFVFANTPSEGGGP